MTDDGLCDRCGTDHGGESRETFLGMLRCVEAQAGVIQARAGRLAQQMAEADEEERGDDAAALGVEEDNDG